MDFIYQLLIMTLFRFIFFCFTYKKEDILTYFDFKQIGARKIDGLSGAPAAELLVAVCRT